MLNRDKASFVLYTSFYDAVQDLAWDRKGMLLDLIFKYEIHGDTDEFQSQFQDMPGDVKMAFRFIKGQLEKDKSKWRDVCAKRAEAGAKGAKAKWGDKPMTTDGKDSNCHFCHKENGKRILGMAKMADNEYEYDNDVVDNNNARARANDAPPAQAPVGKSAATSSTANKFFVKGRSDAECNAALIRARQIDTKALVQMARGAPQNITLEGKPIWLFDEIMDAAVACRVLTERKAAAKASAQEKTKEA